MGNRCAAVAAILAVVVTACGGASPSSAGSSASPQATPVVLGPFPSDEVAGLRTDPDIAYTDVTDCGGLPCTVPGDVIAPTDAAGLPTIVLLGGGSTPFAERRYQQPLAVALAERGAVVFLMSYRSAVTGNYDSQTEEDVRCAVRYARANTQAYGGDPDRVVVVGHSQGGHVALEVATEPEAEVDICLAGGSGKADAVIGLGAPTPRSADASGPAPPMWLFAGSEDLDTATMAEQMREQGYQAEGQVLPGVTHDGITDPAQAPQIVDLIFEAIGSLT